MERVSDARLVILGRTNIVVDGGDFLFWDGKHQRRGNERYCGFSGLSELSALEGGGTSKYIVFCFGYHVFGHSEQASESRFGHDGESPTFH